MKPRIPSAEEARIMAVKQQGQEAAASRRIHEEMEAAADASRRAAENARNNPLGFTYRPDALMEQLDALGPAEHERTRLVIAVLRELVNLNRPAQPIRVI